MTHPSPHYHHLEAEDLVLELADRTSLGEAEALGCLLHRRNHRRGTADEDLDVARGRRQLLLDHISGDEADAAGPVLRRVVQDVVDTELGVAGGKRVEVLLEQNVLGVHVGEDEVDFRLVAGSAAAQNRLDDLEHGCNAGSACNHAKVTDHVGCVNHGALGALDLHLVTNLEVCDVLGNVALVVRLDEKVEETLVLVRRGGRVRAHDLLGLALDGGGE
jgi:hypothetical protein